MFNFLLARVYIKYLNLPWWLPKDNQIVAV